LISQRPVSPDRIGNEAGARGPSAAWRNGKRRPCHERTRADRRYIGNQSPAKSEELRDLHRRILEISPDAKLWFLDGRNDDGKVVSNPNIGYGSATLSYATGDTRAFYKIGDRNIGLRHGSQGQALSVRDLWIAAREGEDHRILHQVQIREGH
jgi:hypothetical protein